MIDFRSLCRDLSVPMIESGHHHVHHGWIQIHCPFCSNGRDGWHLGFNIQKGNFNCWRCGSHRAWDVLLKLLGSEMASKKAWAQYRLDHSFTLEVTKAPVIVRRKTVWTPPGIGELRKPHLDYLRGRLFDPQKLQDQWGLKGTGPLSGTSWNWRVLFPIHNARGHIQAYGGRAIHKDVTPKYRMPDNKNLPVDPKQLLYGIHLVHNTVIVVEGPADVWRLGPGAVASLGVDWSLEQASLLKEIPRRFIMFDPDRPGQKRARKLAEWLGSYNGETELITGLQTDPGDLPQQYADDLMRDLKGVAQ